MMLFKPLKTSKKIGSEGEAIAKNYLSKRGLHYIDSNFHCRLGEIDLIFKQGDTLVFVEVRYRKNTAYGHACETVDKYKQQKLIRAAHYYLQKNHLTDSVDCRFDVIGIEPNNPNSEIQWFKNAFDGV